MSDGIPAQICRHTLHGAKLSPAGVLPPGETENELPPSIVTSAPGRLGRRLIAVSIAALALAVGAAPSIAATPAKACARSAKAKARHAAGPTGPAARRPPAARPARSRRPVNTATQRPGAVPAAFRGYAAATTVAAVAALAAVVPGVDWADVAADGRFWLFAAFVLAGELLPLPVPRRSGRDYITVSTAFAVAVLLVFGAGAAMVVYAVASIVADAILRTRLVNVVFNAAQYVLSVGAAAVVLELAGGHVPVPLTTETLPAIAAAAATFFLANHVLAGVGSALLNRAPISRYLVEDFSFHTITAGFALALAPVVVASAQATLRARSPLCFLPMLAIYLGGRQAAINEHRATHDLLTDLPNRSLLRDRLAAALEQRAPRPDRRSSC